MEEEVEKIDPRSLPCVALSELRYLPEHAGVYFVIEENGEIAYIGQSTNLQRRWRAHSVHPDVCDPSDLQAARRIRLAWLAVDDVSTLKDLERQLIQRFLPRLNDSHTRPAQTTRAPRYVVPLTRDDNILTAREAAKRLGVKQGTIRVWLCKNPAIFPNARKEETVRGQVWLIPASDLEGIKVRSRGRPTKKSRQGEETGG